MLKQVGFAALTILVISASNSALAQQPQPPVKPTVSGKPAPKKATRAIVIEKSAEDPAPTPPAGPPVDEAKGVSKPSAPIAVAKPADNPPPAAEKPEIADKPPPAVKKPVLRDKPIVRAKPRPQRPRYGYGGYY
jgi:hypothetical protein